MSYYYQYYIGYKQDGKIYPLGPYDAFGKLRPVIEKSRSFASDLHDDFYKVSEKQISDELRKKFEYEDYNGEKICNVKYLSIDDLPTGSLYKKGYFLIDDVQAWEQGGDDILFCNMITPLIYAEKLKKEMTFGKNQPKKDEYGEEYTEPNASDYMYYAACDCTSKEYEAFLIREAVNMLYDYDFFHEGNKRIVILENEG